MARVTLAEIAARQAALNRQWADESDAWRKTPEGLAWLAEQARLAEADARYAAAHPPEIDLADDTDEEEF